MPLRGGAPAHGALAGTVTGGAGASKLAGKVAAADAGAAVKVESAIAEAQVAKVKLQSTEIAANATAPVAKFSDYISKEGATHGKDAVFKGL